MSSGRLHGHHLIPPLGSYGFDSALKSLNVSSTYFLFDVFLLQLKSLGDLCGLMSKKGPSSEDLNRTVDLLAGLGDERPETGEFSDQTLLSDDTLGLACNI